MSFLSPAADAWHAGAPAAMGGQSLAATIDVAPVSTVLARLHAQDRRGALSGGSATAAAGAAPASGRTHVPASAAQGRFLYLIARAINAQNIVEFGSSAGLSTLYLAAAAHDNFGGHVIGTEISPDRHALATRHLREAGLERFVDLRCGDARVTLSADLPRSIDMVLLDGSKDLYRPVLDLLRSRLRPGAVVLADQVHTYRQTLAPLVCGLKSGTAGFQSGTLPFPAGLEFAIVC